MRKKIVLNSKRKFTEEFKKSRVSEYERGEFTVQEICKLYQIHSTQIYRWIYKYSAYNKRGYKIVEMSESSEHKVKELQDRISELERIVGQKQLHVDYLEKMIEIAKAELGIDIKKNSNTSLSTGSEKTSKK